MGGVDAVDVYISYYRIHIKSKKYYLRIFFHLVDYFIFLFGVIYFFYLVNLFFMFHLV